LLDAGVNDFSISLDACCASTIDKMSGTKGRMASILKSIRFLAERTYVTVGIVLNEFNRHELEDTIRLAVSMGVSDIRVIPAAQHSSELPKIDSDIKFKILQYRKNNASQGVPVRGIRQYDSHMCPLVLDDVVIAGQDHYPCIIYLREGGSPIGSIDSKTFREDRKLWFENHDTHKDDICCHNCLDVCRQYNNQWLNFQEYGAPKLSADNFDWTAWRLGSESFSEVFGEHLRFADVQSNANLRSKIKNATIGYCHSSECQVRPKENHCCVMFHIGDGRERWTHIRNDEMYLIYGGGKHVSR
jgi:hypothetical protein